MANFAQLICQQLLPDQLRYSNLNFFLSETPYSAQIILRKPFVKECSGPDDALLLASDKIDNKNEMINLNEEKVNLNPITHGGGSLGPRATSRLSETP